MSEEVIIVEYNPKWKSIFESEKEILLDSIGEYIQQIEHIGSTAITGLAAKPIIDILVGVETITKAEKCIPILEELNYQYVPEFEAELPERRYFRKPPRGFGKRKFHLHMVETTSYFWKRQLLFREYLSTHSQTRDEYTQLKKDLSVKYRNDRVAYTNSKTDFILKILEKAQKE
ncbi:MAG: GrpB family protein [Candidatus Heimdallarchaeota archaeon]|nr:GrpB family protein [Candidatus Heimdallarchaeota archaeon]